MTLDLDFEGLRFDNTFESLNDKLRQSSCSLIVHHHAQFLHQMSIHGEIQANHVRRLVTVIFVFKIGETWVQEQTKWIDLKVNKPDPIRSLDKLITDAIEI